LCTRLLKGWSDLQAQDMQVSRISGGISNLLVKVEPPPPLQPVAVKVRVFGDKTELLIDREAEKHLLLRLNQAGFGALVVGLFGNGRIEQFLTAKTLTPEEMSDPRFIPHIARRLRAFHDLKMDAEAAATAAAAAASAPNPTGWDSMFCWLAMAEGLSFAHDPAKQAVYDKVDFRAMRTELTALREMCERVGSTRVLCHNDLLAGNILLQFIDFEYSCRGPRGFDWGNHFNEYAGFDCVYDRFPSPEQQKVFFRHYLSPRDGNSNQGQGEAVLDCLVAEACVFALASHAYWGVWSFIQARYSPIDFDYLDYSRMRWAEY
ncbi:choline, partial [Volvox carteri f. nagariensis]